MREPISELELYYLLPRIIQQSGNGLTEQHLFVTTKNGVAVLAYDFADIEKKIDPHYLKAKNERLANIDRSLKNIPETAEFARIGIVARVGAMKPYRPTPGQLEALADRDAARRGALTVKPVDGGVVATPAPAKMPTCEPISADELAKLNTMRTLVAEASGVDGDKIMFAFGVACKPAIYLAGEPKNKRSKAQAAAVAAFTENFDKVQTAVATMVEAKAIRPIDVITESAAQGFMTRQP